MGGTAWVDDANGDVYATRDSTEPLNCTACGNRIGLAAFTLRPDGAVHDTCPV